jgi:hypothetical protein
MVRTTTLGPLRADPIEGITLSSFIGPSGEMLNSGTDRFHNHHRSEFPEDCFC